MIPFIQEVGVVKRTIIIEKTKGRFNKNELVNSQQGQVLLKRAKDNSLKIACICNGIDDPLPLHVRKIGTKEKAHFTLVRNSLTMDKHNVLCPNFGILVEKEDLDNTIFQENQFVRKIKNSTLLIGEFLLFYGWKNYIENKNYSNMPTVKNVFYTLYNDDSIDYRFSYSTIEIDLKSVLLKPFVKYYRTDVSKYLIRAFENIQNKLPKYPMYILGQILSVKKYDDNYSLITLLEPFKENYFTLVVKTKAFKQNWEQINVVKADMYLSCFINYSTKQFLEVISLSIIPVFKKNGALVYNDEEVDFINALVGKNIYFLKSPRSFNPFKEIFSEYIPDFFLLNNKKEKMIIAEVLAYEKTGEYWEDYWLNANKKIHYFQSQNKFGYFYWNAYEGKPMPPLYRPKDI